MLIRDIELLVRMARSEDLVAIRDLQLLSLKVLAAKDYTPPQLTALVRSKESLRGWDELHFVAEVSGLIVGFGALALGQPWVNALFVHPKFTRQGIATRLLGAMEEEAMRRGDRRLWVMSSLTGEPFYRSVGFESLERNVIPVDDSPVAVPCVRMRKGLVADWTEGYQHDQYHANTFGATLRNIGWMIAGAVGMVILGELLRRLLKV
jgi:putative acetyltransferase